MFFLIFLVFDDSCWFSFVFAVCALVSCFFLAGFVPGFDHAFSQQLNTRTFAVDDSLIVARSAL